MQHILAPGDRLRPTCIAVQIRRNDLQGGCRGQLADRGPHLVRAGQVADCGTHLPAFSSN